ncbi:MAG TPA: hypothetical protein VFQ75_00675 [Candidatus Limnocylindrales bacterium]|nr:hypothetical protein [Candidatus Limnocylindrales bacterium]
MRSKTCLWGVLSMRSLVFGIGLAGLIGVAVLAPPFARAGTTGPSIPFGAAIAASRLVVIATTELRADGAIVVHVERVLAGARPATSSLVFTEPQDPPAFVDGGRAVIAFGEPTSIEAAAPTRAWQISADGYVDPDGIQPADGLPPTLAALYTWFGVPMRVEPAAGADGGLANALGPILLVLVALALAEGGIAHRDRRRAPGG